MAGVLYERAKEYVNQSFGVKSEPHFERTVFWMEKFWPETTEAHRISAYGHDIERAFRDKDKFIPENYLDPVFMKNHQERGAALLAGFLKSEQAPDVLIEKVRDLVSCHEIGGNEEQDALRDADSVSFFETNARKFVQEKAPLEGYGKIKEKLDWMYSRIGSEERKKFAENNYKEWIRALEEYK